MKQYRQFLATSLSFNFLSLNVFSIYSAEQFSNNRFLNLSKWNQMIKTGLDPASEVTFECLSVHFKCKYYLWVSGVSWGRVRQRLNWGRSCHAPAVTTLLFISLRPADPVVGRGRSAAAGLRLALGRGLLQLLERFLDNQRPTWQLRRAIGGWCPVGNSGLWLRAHTVSGNRQTQTSIHGLDLTQLCRFKFLIKGVLYLELNISAWPVHISDSRLVVILSHTFVTCGEERGPFRLALFICSDDMLFFPGCNMPCLVVCPAAFFLVSGSL